VKTRHDRALRRREIPVAFQLLIKGGDGIMYVCQ
jgi:hypothetical protein